MRRTKRIYLITLIVAMLLNIVLIAPPIPARAQSFTQTFDFTLSSSGATLGLPGAFACDYASSSEWGEYVAGVGYRSRPAAALGGGGANLCLRIHFAVTNITSIEITGAKDVSFTSYVCTANAADCTVFNADSGTYRDGVSPFTYTANGGLPTNATEIGIVWQTGAVGTLTISQIMVNGTGTNPFIQPGDTPPESSPSSPPPPLSGLPDCPLLGAATATFSNLPGAWTLTGTATNPDGATRGLEIRNGGASILMNLSTEHQYTIEIKARNGSGNQNGLRVGLGRQTMNPIPIDPGGSVDVKLPEANFMPGSPYDILGVSHGIDPGNYFTLLVFRNSLDGFVDDTVIIDYICVRDVGGNTVSGAGGEAGSIAGRTLPEECKTEPKRGWDIKFQSGFFPTDAVYNLYFQVNREFSYLSAILARLIPCFFRPTLAEMQEIGDDTFNFLLRAREWIDLFLNNFSRFAGIAAEYVAGWLGNVIRAVFNGFIQLLNNLGLGQIVNDVLHFLNAILPKGIASIPEVIGTVWTAFSNFVNFVATVIVGFIQGIFDTIAMLFGVTRTIINAEPIPLPIPGFCDTTAASIPENCIWVFTVDYTILDPDSPIGAAIPLLKGGAGIGLIWWAIHAFRSSTMEQATSEN